MENFDTLRNTILVRYNQSQATPVDQDDRFFKSYFLGVLSAILTEKQIADATKRWSDAIKTIDNL